MGGMRASEGAALVAEQHGFEHVLGNRGAIDGNEQAGGARGAAVNEPGQYFLAGSRLAHDEHRAVAGRDASREVDKPQRTRRARYRICLRACRNGGVGVGTRLFVCHWASHNTVGTGGSARGVPG